MCSIGSVNCGIGTNMNTNQKRNGHICNNENIDQTNLLNYFSNANNPLGFKADLTEDIFTKSPKTKEESFEKAINKAISDTLNMVNNSGSVIIDGKIYFVIKQPDTSFSKMTFAPSYKEVVIINGKEYPVKEVPHPFASDGKIKVVQVNGKNYKINSHIGNI